jgi:hypothetical protein
MRRRLRLRFDPLVPRFAHGVLAALLVVATAGSAGAGVEIGLNFTGRVGPAEGNVIEFPDPMGAVGEQHIVELLNDGYAVYRKSDGALVESTSTLNEFWQAAGVTPVGYAANSRVLYDAASQRWFAVSTDGWTGNKFLPNSYLVAVSKSADPTEGWTGFKVDGDPTDTGAVHGSYLGMNADGLYVVAQRNAVGPEPSPYLSQTLLVLPKQDLLAPTPSVANATNWTNPSPAVYASQPVVNLDGTGLPETLLLGRFAPFGFLQTNEISGSIESPVLGPSTLIAVDNTASGVFHAVQPGSKADLWAGFDTFSGNAVQLGGSIWAAQTTRVDGRLAVRWYEIDEATNSVLQFGDLSDPTLDLFFPSIAVNKFGQVVIGMNGSSETEFVGSYAAVGETVGGITSFGVLIVLQAGRAGYERIIPVIDPVFGNFWGQYSATVVDPSDPHRFWTFQEYVEAEDIYAVRITELILTPQCSDGLDNDGDDLIDSPDDLGCDSPSDLSERAEPGSQYQCDDGIDNDGDGFIDAPDDPGCPFSYATIENSQCDDGIDNDGNGVTDFADSKCTQEWPYWETLPCGLGAELALVMPLLGLVASRRRRAAI